MFLVWQSTKVRTNKNSGCIAQKMLLWVMVEYEWKSQNSISEKTTTDLQQSPSHTPGEAAW